MITGLGGAPSTYELAFEGGKAGGTLPPLIPMVVCSTDDDARSSTGIPTWPAATATAVSTCSAGHLAHAHGQSG